MTAATAETKPIPLEEVKKLLSYDPETGELTWKISRRGASAGSIAGSLTGKGYRQVMINRVPYLAHRVIWALHYGIDPGESTVDHKNKNRQDNRISNLRLASDSVQQHNKNIKGFCWDITRNKWVAYITKDGITKTIGRFDCPLLARIAHEEASLELYGF